MALKADWSISQIYPKYNFLSLSPGEEKRIGFQLLSSSNRDKEITNIKFFATRETSKFRWLELPSLTE